MRERTVDELYEVDPEDGENENPDPGGRNGE